MIAAMQMYDWGDNHADVAAYWDAVRDRLIAAGIAAPDALDHGHAIGSVWGRSDLVLGQTCGLPFVRGLCGDASVVGRPDYGVEGARGGTYASALIVRAGAQGDLAAHLGTRVAVNEIGSQSGCNALVDAVLDTGADPAGPLFADAVLTGSHRASARAVAEARADIAAIDAVALDLLSRFDVDVHGAVQVLGWTRPMPALPFIVGPNLRDAADTVCRALDAAAQELAHRRSAGVPVRVIPAKSGDYDPIRQMAHRVGGAVLAPGVILPVPDHNS